VKRRSLTARDGTFPDVVSASGGTPEALTRAAVEALGGMGRFVARGQRVVVKPNIGWDRPPELAANTNPDVVAAVVRLCLEAGAASVVVADVSCHEARACYAHSGIEAAVKAVGGSLVLPEPHLLREVDLGGSTLGPQPVLEPFLAADVIVNVPIAKHHSLTGVTLGMKNFYGLIGGARGRLHQHIHESLADLADFARPALTIVDAWRVLVRNGPTGGSLSDVEERHMLLASADPVAVDGWAARTLFRIDPRRLSYLRLAEARGLGVPVAGAEQVKSVDLGA
jgi:uncharacterized protein (DUF362 family)